MPIWIPHQFVFRALSLLLMGTALLKLQGLAVDPLARRGLLATPEIQLAVVELELVLAAWLWFGVKAPLRPWLGALAAFGAFAGASAYMGIIGQSSCGCAGSLVTLSPWYAFGLDLIALTLLVLGRPNLSESRKHPVHAATGLRPALYCLGGLALVSALFFGSAHVAFGSVAATLAYLRGERISVSPRLVDLGSLAAGSTHEATVEVHNWTDQPIRLIGGTADCSCTVLHDLPLVIPAGEGRAVRLATRLKSKPGIFTRKAGFVVEDHGMKQLTFRITGRIIEHATQSARNSAGRRF